MVYAKWYSGIVVYAKWGIKGNNIQESGVVYAAKSLLLIGANEPHQLSHFHHHHHRRYRYMCCYVNVVQSQMKPRTIKIMCKIICIST